MSERFSRTERLLGTGAMQKLAAARVAIFGLGGVGGAAAEALARCGIGALDLFDNDVVALSNLNRQIIATEQTVGRPKVDVMKERILAVNPQAAVEAHRLFYLPACTSIDFSRYDYVVDAIDTVSGKIGIVLGAKAANVPVISAMGAGNKLDPTAFRVADLSETSVCPLAKVMRRELKKRGVEHLKVVYSQEPPKACAPAEDKASGRSAPGSVSFVPPVVGLILAGEVVRDLIQI